MSFQVRLGNLTLDGTYRWEETQRSRVSIETFPRRQGGIVPVVPLKDVKTGRFDFVAYKDTEAELFDYLDSLKAELAKGRGSLTLLDNDRYWYAIKTNFAIVHQTGQGLTSAAGTIEFVIADPYSYSSGGEQSHVEANVSVSPQGFAVANLGGAATPPRIEIKAFAADKTGTFKLTNSASGLYIQWTGSILSTKTLIINCAADPFTVTNDGANALSGFLGSKNFLLLAGDINTSLPSGWNTLSYEGPTGVDLTVAWTERWE